MITHISNLESEIGSLSFYSKSLSSDWRDGTQKAFHNHYISPLENKIKESSGKLHMHTVKMITVEEELTSILSDLK